MFYPAPIDFKPKSDIINFDRTFHKKVLDSSTDLKKYR